ncbi:neurotrimin-like [Teleopsis dalmanni]|uniref:neurotrimin-like n=1 Tax=Teleopsis dalmanni TaxID=139649 RepID=UPI0018CE5941|nr:neurotrimin-like [Teleopsis dalmanni]
MPHEKTHNALNSIPFFGPDPKFNGPISNVTVPVGRDATLTCVVHDLVTFKVAWLRVDTQTILSIQNHVITKNHRIGIAHTEHRIWQLRIRDVRESDRGWYMCQINTDPMKSQVGYLDVVVPPDIIDYETSQDMNVKEGQNISLTCSATGLPFPAITWRREKDLPITSNNGREVYSIEGPNITLWEVTRSSMGAYLCIASNGVPPTVSKRISVIVNFKPNIWTRYDTIYVNYGQKITLECITEGYPTTVNFWLKEKDFIQGGTYESLTLDNVYKIVMRLTIKPSKAKDFGEYKCVAKNMVGETDQSITILHKAKKDIHQSNQIRNNGNQLIVIEATQLTSVGDKSHDSVGEFTLPNFTSHSLYMSEKFYHAT